MTPQRFSIRRKILLGFGFTVAMLAVIALITWRSTRGFLSTAELVAQSRESLETSERVLRHLLEMESGRRGFIITGDDRHLRGFEGAQTAAIRDFGRLRILTFGSPDQGLRFERMKLLISRSFALQEAEIAARRVGGLSAAVGVFARAENDATMAEIRDVMNELVADEREVLADRSALTRQIGQATRLVIVVGSTITLAVLLLAVVMILRDIAARRRAETALAEQHHLLGSIIDTMPDHVFVKDAKGRFIMNNKAHRRYLRLGEATAVEGKTVHDFFPPELAAKYDADDQHVLETGEPLRNREELGVPSNGGELWLLTTKVPLREPGGRILGLVCVSADISERKADEERVKRFAAQLERSNAELQNFASVASHDLQEPLRKIQAFGDRLRAKCGDGLGDLGRDYLARMQNAAERMQTLIQDLLKLSRVTSRAQPFTACDLNLVVREVLVDLEVAIEQKGARIEVSPLPVLEADPLQMRQLFQNLISNALKFQQPGEAPEVIVESKALICADHQVPGAAPGEEVCQLMVKDNGIGFEEKFAEQIFVVFQRLHTRSEYEGTGIGLAVCRKITDRHGGTIVAKSTPGQGATFIVTLPVHQPSDEALD